MAWPCKPDMRGRSVTARRNLACKFQDGSLYRQEGATSAHAWPVYRVVLPGSLLTGHRAEKLYAGSAQHFQGSFSDYQISMQFCPAFVLPARSWQSAIVYYGQKRKKPAGSQVLVSRSQIQPQGLLQSREAHHHPCTRTSGGKSDATYNADMNAQQNSSFWLSNGPCKGGLQTSKFNGVSCFVDHCSLT